MGVDPFTLVGTVRNAGSTSILAGGITPRLHLLAGLDYVEGDTAPKLPQLAPNQAITFRWRVLPVTPDSSLVACFALESADGAPVVQLASVPHVAEAPPAQSAAIAKLPVAWSTRNLSGIENSRLRARIASTANGVPLLLLSSVQAGGWRKVAVSVPVAEVLSAEPGQRAWWEVFKLTQVEPRQTVDEARLTLSGRFGIRWRATLTLSLRANSAVLDLSFRLVPAREMLLSGIRFAPIFAESGSNSANIQTLPARPSGGGVLTALRWAGLTAGIVRPAIGPFDNWEPVPIPTVQGADYYLLSSQYRAVGAAASLTPGMAVTMVARIFAFNPSQSILDAQKVWLRKTP